MRRICLGRPEMVCCSSENFGKASAMVDCGRALIRIARKGPATLDSARARLSFGNAAGRLSCKGRFAIAGVQKSTQEWNFRRRSFGILSRLDHRRGRLVDRGSGRCRPYPLCPSSRCPFSDDGKRPPECRVSVKQAPPVVHVGQHRVAQGRGATEPGIGLHDGECRGGEPGSRL
jgi:hypothetical protein